jgi:Fic family protein
MPTFPLARRKASSSKAKTATTWPCAAPRGTIRTEALDWTPWLTFFLRVLQRQMRRLREKVERERLVLAKLPDLAVQILDHARDHGRITIGDAVSITAASRNMLKLHFKTLRERGLLVLHGQGRGAWYSLP